MDYEEVVEKFSNKPIKITSVDQLYGLIDASECTREFFICLAGGLCRSWKNICFADALDKNGDYKFWIKNEIDETVQVLTKKNIMNDKYTNIGKAIREGGFYLCDGNWNYDCEDVKWCNIEA